MSMLPFLMASEAFNDDDHFAIEALQSECLLHSILLVMHYGRLCLRVLQYQAEWGSVATMDMDFVSFILMV